MNLRERIVVISDLHLGCGNELAIFEAGVELKQLIASVRDRPGKDTLVILGDALDFLQQEPALSFLRAVALEKTGKILKHNKEIIEALGSLARTHDKEIIWAIGNHDLELLFPEVRGLIEDEMRPRPGGLRWHLNADALIWPLGNGRDLRLVHGNAADAWNAVNYDEVQAVAEKGGSPDFAWPQGSRLVAGVLNPLKQDGHGYVDLLKPEVSTALPLALALWPDRTRALLSAAFGPSSRALGRRVKQALSQGAVFGADDETQPELEGWELLAQTLSRAGLDARDDAGSPDLVAKDMGSWLEDAEDDAVDAIIDDQPGAPTFGDGGLRRAFTFLLRSAAYAGNAASTSFALHGDDSLKRQTLLALKNANAALVVAGHTHLARCVTYPEGWYINTGTWARLMHLPANLGLSAFQDLARSLRNNDLAALPADARPFCTPTYVEIALYDGQPPPGVPGWSATLFQWTRGMPEPDPLGKVP